MPSDRLDLIRRDLTVTTPGWKVRLRVGVVALAALACAAGALFSSGRPARVVLGFCAVFFGFVTLAGFLLSRGRTVKVVSVTDKGIAAPQGLLHWDEIERVETGVISRHHVLQIWAVDPLVLARRSGSPLIWVFGWLARITNGPVLVFTDHTAPIDELSTEIQRRIANSPTPLILDERNDTVATSAGHTHLLVDDD